MYPEENKNKIHSSSGPKDNNSSKDKEQPQPKEKESQNAAPLQLVKGKDTSQFDLYADPNNRKSISLILSTIANQMSTDGMYTFFTNLKVNLENCESMLVVYILGWSSFYRITKDEFDKAKSTHKNIEGISAFVKREIQNKYAVNCFLTNIFLSIQGDLIKLKDFHKKAFELAK